MATMNLYRKDSQMTVNARPHEQGVALIQTLMIMALMLALLMGISLTAISELGVTSTYAKQTIAMQAAEAGLNHAASLVRNYTGDDFTHLLGLRPATGTVNPEYDFNPNYLQGNNPFISANISNFGTGSVMIDYDSTTPSLGCPLLDGVTGAAVPGAYYKVSLIDNEASYSTTNPKVPNFTPPAGFIESNGLNANDPWTDKDNRIVVYSTGTYSNASVTLEGWIAFLSYPALVSNKDIEVSGSAQLLGTFGSVHSNQNLNISGSPYIQQSATATGDVNLSGGGYQIDGFYGGLQPQIDLPKFVTTAPIVNGGPNTTPRIQDYLIRAANVLLIDPSFADGAHKTDPTDTTGTAAQNKATANLNNLAQRLNVSYTSLITALDQSGSSGTRIQQNNEGAVKITRSTPSSQGAAAVFNVSDTGWQYTNGGGGSWGIKPSGGATVNINANDGTATGNVYYVIGQDNNSSGNANGGNVALSGNLGGNLDNITIFTTGSVYTTGTTNFTAKMRRLHTPELPPFVDVDVLFVATEDVKIRGDVDASSAPGGPTFNGIVYCGEQFDLSGNGNFNGQVLGWGNPDMHNSPVSANVATGSFTLTLNNGNSFGRVSMVSWRQIKR